ncbi:aa3-type cytochrome c oxidase subunit IV [uncultured Phenylobacterium sp.]|uniref:aa3-type cytochrome c oxidase subunit IV n=1 Tax=uncultured Phenylobacterium sp. TaxID=349273 RepID=UPI0025D5F09C|nr:aa3-type cytochrome c oxidase subunit IV [uncultured Phenylobacterium sp.]
MASGSQFGDQTMDVVVHEKTYHAFSILTRWAMLVIGDATFFLTLWFATGAGFWGALFIAGAAFVIGYLFLVRHEEKQPLDVWVEGR